MTDRLTKEQVAEIRARAEKATVGPWSVHDQDIWCDNDDGYPNVPMWKSKHREYRRWGREFTYEQVDCDADFIAAARSDIPALIATLSSVEEENKRLRAEYRSTCDELFDLRMRFGVGPYDPAPSAQCTCNFTRGDGFSNMHAADCPLLRDAADARADSLSRDLAEARKALEKIRRVPQERPTTGHDKYSCSWCNGSAEIARAALKESSNA